MLVAGIDVQQDTLQGHVLVKSRIGFIRPSGGGQTQELGQDQKTVVQGLLGIGVGLLILVLLR